MTCTVPNESPQPKRIFVDRDVYDVNQLNQLFEYEKPKSKQIREFFPAKINLKSCLYRTVPSLYWLPRYKWRRDISGDLIAGITVAIMHVPYGMMNALLANIPPVYGMYMSFFPVLVYSFFGTSRHISMGPFAIVSLMAGKAVITFELSNDVNDMENMVTNYSDPLMIDYVDTYTNIQVVTAVTFATGIIHLLMFALRLGDVVSTLLSQTLVNGFVSGSVVHIITSQINDLLGMSIPKSSGMFSMIHTWVYIALNVQNMNKIAAFISLIVMITIYVVNGNKLKQWIKKRTSFPIPIELIILISTTLASRYFGFRSHYGVKDIGKIPTGLPQATLPQFELLKNVWSDSLIIAIVSYTITLSMALIFAQQDNYDVDPNQEFLAMSLGNMFGSIFSCLPFACSLSRSSMQKAVGGKTQMASLISCSLLLTVLLWFGPFFEPLPKCVLAAIIIMSLKNMLFEARKFVQIWNLSHADGLIWIITFFSVIFLNIDIGLLVGIISSLAITFFSSLRPTMSLLGQLGPGNIHDVYVDLRRYKKAVEVPYVKIIGFSGNLNFATSVEFKNNVYQLSGMNPKKELNQRLKFQKDKENRKSTDVKSMRSVQISTHITHLIIDLSGLSQVDPAGIQVLFLIIEQFKKVDITVLLSGCAGVNYEKIMKFASSGDYVNTKELLAIFPTIHDAVVSCKNN